MTQNGYVSREASQSAIIASSGSASGCANWRVENIVVPKPRPLNTSSRFQTFMRLLRLTERERRDGREHLDAERLGDGEAEDQVAELALRGRRIADRRGEVIAEDDADADAGADPGANQQLGKVADPVYRSKSALTLAG